MFSMYWGLLIWGTLVVAQVVDFRCSESFCQEYVSKNGCPVLPEHCTEEILLQNPDLGKLMPSPSICNCCKFCISYLTKGDECVIGKAGQPVPTTVCGPRLMCQKENADDESAICTRLKSPCMDAQLTWDEMRENGTLGSNVLRPQCNDKGYFETAHCIPGATCYCVNPVDGTRIFGETPYTSVSTPDDMHCSCSVALWKANQVFEEKKEGLMCLPDGSYDQLQCVDSKCFCIDPETLTIQGKQFVHVTDISPDTLTCFDPDIHTVGKYLKPCQEEKFIVHQTLELLNLEGIFGLGLKEPSCDEDGHYSSLQEWENMKVCVNPYNEKIEEFEVDKAASEAKGMNCKCARTRWLMTTTADETHVSELPVCCPNGNFAEWQCRRGTCYCVDENGNQFGPENRSVDQLVCYDERGECSLYIP